MWKMSYFEIGIAALAILSLSVSPSAAAIITVSTSPPNLIPQPAGGGTYYIRELAETATLTAYPVTGYMFQRWIKTAEGDLVTNDVVSTNATYSFNVTVNQDYLAVYTPILYIISVSTSPSYLTPQPAGGNTYYYGDNITVTAQQVANYSFQRWTENKKSVSTSDAYSFNVSENRSLVAEYSKVATPTITLDTSSGTPRSEITINGTGFDIFAEDFPQVSIYFDGTAVKENVKMNKDDSGTLGSFRTAFTIPPNTKSGIHRITAQGPKNSAYADFVVEYPYPWKEILEISGIIGVLVGLKYLYPKFMKFPPQPLSNIGKHLPITIETRGGIESIEPHPRDYAIKVEVKGGVERL